LAFTLSFAYLIGGRIPYFIFYTSLVLVVIGFLWARIIGRITAVCYTEASSAQVGGKVKVLIEVKNLTGWPVPWVQYWVQMPATFGLPDNLACYTFSLAPHEKKTFSEMVECRRRGIFTWGCGLLKTGDLFGTFVNSLSVGELRELTVLPQIFDLGHGLETMTGLRPGDSFWSRKAGRSGASFMGVRKYDHGDGISRIHWKASARSQNFLVKEFQKPKLLDCMLYLDLNEENHAGEGPTGSAEKAVALIASIAGAGIKAGYGIGLVVFGAGRGYIPIGYGKGHFALILQTLVRFGQAKGDDFGEALSHELALLQRKCQVIAATGCLNEKLVDGLLRAKLKGQYSSLFLLKLESFADRETNLNERANCLDRLGAAGIPVVGITKDSDLRLVFRGLEYEAG